MPCRYIASVYWTLTTCTTVGYGDIVAISDVERVYAVFVLIGGAGRARSPSLQIAALAMPTLLCVAPRVSHLSGHVVVPCLPNAVPVPSAGLSNTPCEHGAAIFAVFLGTITSLVSNGNLAAARIAAEKYRIDSFLRARRVPAHLAGRVRSHHLAQLQRDLDREEHDLVQGGLWLTSACLHACARMTWRARWRSLCGTTWQRGCWRQVCTGAAELHTL